MPARTRATDGLGARFVTASRAARVLGVSIKALRVYEQAGLIRPPRSPAGWRLYGTRELDDARDVIAWRRLGIGLADIATLQAADAGKRRKLLRVYQAALEARAEAVAAATQHAGGRRQDSAVDPSQPARRRPRRRAWDHVAVELPWPWDGERWVLDGLGPLTFITGPLGSGKTRLAHCLARAIPGASFVGLDRLDDGASSARNRLSGDPRSRRASRPRCPAGRGRRHGRPGRRWRSSPRFTPAPRRPRGGHDRAGSRRGDATRRDAGTSARGGAPLVLMTRSSSILDLAEVKDTERIIYCPANHGAPLQVAPREGAPASRW
ncbi:MAG: MerR family transcriptional regulator [Vicinamibacterales bacterium]